MSAFSQHIGGRVRYYRKARGWTVEQLAQEIGKSKATVSKYESGAVYMDVETLYAISRALNVHIKYLTDLEPPRQAEPVSASYFDRPTAYMYYFDGRVRRLVRSLLRFAPATDGGIDVTLYVGLLHFDDPMSCQHLFTGSLLPYDTITHMVLTNELNRAERMYICMLNPMQNHMPAVGMLSGIGSTPFFAPIAIKTLISKEPLEESQALMQVIHLKHEEWELMRQNNMMVINRPSALSLT